MKIFPALISLLALTATSACAQQAPLVPVGKITPLPQAAQAAQAAQIAQIARIETPVSHVVQISVDALGAKYLEKFVTETPAEFPNFVRLQREGASTLNARTDYEYTVTLPNHTSMVTGRPVQTPQNWAQAKGHGWTSNGNFPAEGVPASLHATNPDSADGALAYTATTFDVVHDAGLSTAIYAGKSKFRLFSVSQGEELGAENKYGRNKIDTVMIGRDVPDEFIASLREKAPNYAFFHFANTDAVGHSKGYLGPDYRDAVKKVDAQLGEILDLISTDEGWKNKGVVILSADHGGKPGTKGHGDNDEPYNYTIPFLVWGAGVKAGADLYDLNPTTRTNPGTSRPEYAPTNQPIRNGDGGNLALQLLGLPAIPGSHINDKQDLAVR